MAGIQHGLDITARLILDPGDPVWAEDPCYFVVPAMLEALSAKIIPVPVDRSGLDVREGERRCDRARLAYVTPAHQFPLGATMTVDRRLLLLRWAWRTGGLIFEDDYDSEYRYSGRPIPALQGLGGHESVISRGASARCSSPACAWATSSSPLPSSTRSPPRGTWRTTTPPSSSRRFCATSCRRALRTAPSTDARALCEPPRRPATSVERKLGGLLEVQEVEAGVQTLGWLRERLEAEAVARAAAEVGIEVIPLSRFVLEAERPEGLLLGFAAVDDREIHRGVDALARALGSCLKKSRPRRGA